LIPDQERRYATDAADHMAIPIHFLPADDYKLYEGCDDPKAQGPEPTHNPDTALGIDAVNRMAAHSRVILTGWDGDALLNEAPLTFLRALLAQREFGQLFLVSGRLLATRPGQVARALWTRLRKERAHQAEQTFPPWINPELEKRLNLRQRWDQHHRQPVVTHPIRPYSYRTFDYILRLSNFFDPFDAGLTKAHLEYRHPLFDLRLLEYCLSLPPLPWCVRKEILRSSMKGRLPESVRQRPKTPLAGFPYIARLQQDKTQWVDSLAATAAPSLYDYVNPCKIPPIWSNQSPVEAWTSMRPWSLNFWLKSPSVRTIKLIPHSGVTHASSRQ
jgi:asparagine synthase (glutamine-hydrolysing)